MPTRRPAKRPPPPLRCSTERGLHRFTDFGLANPGALWDFRGRHPEASLHLEPSPALVVSLALAAGIAAQALAIHLKIPGIVVLLATGVLLGPDALGIVRPELLGDALHSLVGFAVAVILFEGGMNLDLQRLRRSAAVIQRLVTVGALITAGGGALSAYLILGWSPSLSILFGTLVVVTGPTVITPLLRRIRVRTRVATVLEAEGVLIDAIGAVIAVVALTVATSPAANFHDAAAALVQRYGMGLLVGGAVGLLIAALLRLPLVVPEGLENVLTLSLVLAGYQTSHALVEESGIVCVVVAGLVVGNVRSEALRDLREFKEQLTVLLIGMLFVLLAADVRLVEIRALLWPGLLVVGCLMFVVRPIQVLVCTSGSELDWRERLFIGWLAPRGIVAAAVASLFADSLGEAGIPGGGELRALVFLVIATTIAVQGTTGPLLASWLGLRRPLDRGYVLLGASPVGLALGRILRDHGEEVIFLDANPAAARAAQEAGFRVLFGNALDDRLLARAELDGRAGALALTPNEGVNLLFGQKARKEFRLRRVALAARSRSGPIGIERYREAGARLLFGAPHDLEIWSQRLRRGEARVERWRLEAEADGLDPTLADAPDSLVLPLALDRGAQVVPFDSDCRLRAGDVLHLVRHTAGPADAESRAWLVGRGFEPVVA